MTDAEKNTTDTVVFTAPESGLYQFSDGNITLTKRIGENCIYCSELCSDLMRAEGKIKQLEARVEKLANDFKNAVIACKTLAENHSVELSDEVAHFLIVELEGNYLRCALEDIAALKEDEEQNGQPLHSIHIVVFIWTNFRGRTVCCLCCGVGIFKGICF